MAIFPSNLKVPIGICSDHAGFEMKTFIVDLLKAEGIPYTDFGTYSLESCDYADFAHKLGNAIDIGECNLGIALCGSGNGINMTLNKHQSVRAALCWTAGIAHLAVAHNNANIVTLPARFITKEETIEIMKSFFSAKFEGGRHQRRIEKIPLK